MIKIKTPKERDNMDLLELVCQLHSRALRVGTKEMHDAYLEARVELEYRLNGLPPVLPPPSVNTVTIDEGGLTKLRERFKPVASEFANYGRTYDWDKTWDNIFDWFIKELKIK